MEVLRAKAQNSCTTAKIDDEDSHEKGVNEATQR
jgi:hypothetical protein